MGDTLTMQASDGPRSVCTRPHFHANNGDTCRAAALDHQGIVLQPDFLIGMDLAAGRLIRVLPELAGEEVGIYAVYPTRKHLSGNVLWEGACVVLLGAEWAPAHCFRQRCRLAILEAVDAGVEEWGLTSYRSCILSPLA